MIEELTEVGKARACPVCGSQSKARIFQQRFALIEGAGVCRGYDVVLCKECSFAFADRGPTQGEFDDYYERASKYEHALSGGAPAVGDLARFAVVAREVASVLGRKESRIAEVGCSTGGLLHLLKTQHGFANVSGVDPSPACARAARELYGIHVETGTLEAVARVGPFDAIILQQVMEHVVDLEGAIKTLTAALTPTGHLFIEVPDVARFNDDHTPPFQQFSVEHVNFFSSASLSNLLARRGYRETLGAQNESASANSAVFGAFQRSGAPQPLRPDPISEGCLRDYVAACEKLEAGLHQRLDQLLAGGQPFYVWGTGTLTLRLLETSALQAAPIKAFVDSNPRYRGRSVRGLPIIGPGDLPAGQVPILISTVGHAAAIKKQIAEQLSLPNPVWTLF